MPELFILGLWSLVIYIHDIALGVSKSAKRWILCFLSLMLITCARLENAHVFLFRWCVFVGGIDLVQQRVDTSHDLLQIISVCKLSSFGLVMVLTQVVLLFAGFYQTKT